MEFQDVLTDHMDVRRPEFGLFTSTARNAEIIGQRIKPHIGDVIRVEGQGNTPFKTLFGPADAKVLEGFVFQKTEHLIAAIIGRDKIRIRFDIINEPLLMLAEFEVIILLAQFLHLAIDGIKLAILVAIFLGQKRFLFRGIEADVFVLIKLALVVKLLKHLGHHRLMAGVRGAHEVVIGNAELLDERLPILRQPVAIRLGILPGGLGGLLDFLAMLIQAGQVKDLLAKTPARARDHVGDHLLVSMPEMRLAIDVIDGCRDVELLAQGRQVVAEHWLTGKTALFYRNLSWDLADNAYAFLELSARDLLGDDRAAHGGGAG